MQFGLLLTHKHWNLSWQLFEVSDIVRLDNKEDVGASNSRQLAAVYCNLNSGFEVVYSQAPNFISLVQAFVEVLFKLYRTQTCLVAERQEIKHLGHFEANTYLPSFTPSLLKGAQHLDHLDHLCCYHLH